MSLHKPSCHVISLFVSLCLSTTLPSLMFFSVPELTWPFRSRTIPLSEMCIRSRKAVWALYIDVVCINYDGNAFDCAVMAVMAALKSGQRSFSAQALPGLR